MSHRPKYLVNGEEFTQDDWEKMMAALSLRIEACKDNEEHQAAAGWRKTQQKLVRAFHPLCALIRELAERVEFAHEQAPKWMALEAERNELRAALAERDARIAEAVEQIRRQGPGWAHVADKLEGESE